MQHDDAEQAKKKRSPMTETMAEGKKIEAARKGGRQRRKPSHYAANKPREFKSKIAELENGTFDTGNVKYTAKFKKSLTNIANYVQCEYTPFGSGIGDAMRKLNIPIITPPVTPENDVTGPALVLWKEERADWKKRSSALQENIKKAHALVYGQCSPALITKLKGMVGFNAVGRAQDVVQLLLLIREISCKVDGRRQGMYALVQAKK